MMTKNNARLAVRATSFMILFALLLGTVAPAFGQRRTTRRTVRRTTPVRTAPARPAPPPVRYYTVPADTVLRVRMDQQLTSKTARVGDRFTTTVTEPVYADAGVEIMPVGSKVMGRVTSVQKAGRREPGQINVSFYQVELPGGARHTINGSLTTLQADNVNADNEGGVSGRNDRKRDAVFIGGGAATGAIIGAIAGGGKGAGIGAILGGALGTGARVYEKEDEAEVKSGTEFGVILNRAITLTASRL
jgi:hypothetical protein